MENNYDILGVKKTATDEEIKNAYVKLKSKYDPISYDRKDLKEHAQNKTNEITAAFDAIMNERRIARMERDVDTKSNNNSNILSDIQRLIEKNELQRADEMLTTIATENRTARWYFLKGVILYRKGWLMEATNFFETANKMDPTNEEYQRALEKANWQRNGGFGSGPGAGPFGQPGSYPNGAPIGCSFCDICGGILCADFCCDCTGMRGPGRCC